PVYLFLRKFSLQDSRGGSVIVVVLLLTLTLIAIFSAIDQLGISEMGRIARDLTHFIINSLQD
ncbi:two-component system connector SafA, partial [Escherichia coli]|uniref:two-component system connector SafA n=1 Tax=Escherichia coli TaxID=562 RepID=UPI001881C366